jgi:glucose 1-dehydrogenase
MPTQAELLDLYPDKPLKGQIAFVTGANSGIGEGIARHMAAAGASVGLNYVVNPEAADAIVVDIAANGGVAKAFQGDVSKEADVVRMVGEAVQEFGALDIMVNNAGLQRDSEIAQMTLDQWNLVISINLTGQFLCAREAVKQFEKQGNRGVSSALGKIICISSVHEIIPWATHVNYAASKGGIKLLSQSLAQELAPKKIRVNSIGPGAIKTPINKSAWDTPEAEAKLLELIPYGRVGVVDDIGKGAVWLASDMSDYVIGTTLLIDGGMCLYPGFSTNG